jgi:predicted DNA-binding transcriptional regulator AlpA
VFDQNGTRNVPKKQQDRLLMTSAAGRILPVNESVRPPDNQPHDASAARHEDDCPWRDCDTIPVGAEAESDLIARPVGDRDGDEKLPNVYLTAKQVRERYGRVSDMSIWRWLRDPKLNFPRPIRINRRRFWRLSDLDAWDRSREAARS